MNVEAMTALDIGAKIKNREISSPEATKALLERINQVDGEISAYTNINENAIASSEAVQKRIDAGETLSPLAGVPIAIKDNISTKGLKTTCSSKMLDNYTPVFSATVIDNLEKAGLIIIGKTNLDEFAMGNVCETGYKKSTKNPWNLAHVAGGSSGGSAAAVASGEAFCALGSDTGGSIRQPSSFCGITGIKPTYGAVSRFGLLAYASSFDQIGPMGKDIKDCAELLKIIASKDEKDSTSTLANPFDFSACYTGDIKGMKIALPTNYLTTGIDEDVKQAILSTAKQLAALGATVEEIEMPLVDYTVPAYYIIACAEASSNLSRYDGVKYGYRAENATDLADLYSSTRNEGFGAEVKRRIMLGSFVLSSGFYDAYYKKGLLIRSLVKKAYSDLFEKYDLILSPVAPTTAFKSHAFDNDPVSGYLADIYTVSANLAGLPAASLPCGFGKNGMPIGMQLMGKAFHEHDIIKAGYAFQSATDFHKKTVGGMR